MPMTDSRALDLQQDGKQGKEGKRERKWGKRSVGRALGGGLGSMSLVVISRVVFVSLFYPKEIEKQQMMNYMHKREEGRRSAFIEERFRFGDAGGSFLPLKQKKQHCLS